MYDPVEPKIVPDSVCTDIFVRAYAEPKPRRPRRTRGSGEARQNTSRPPSWFDGRFFVFDTETVERHELTFGAFEYYDRRRLVKRAVFHRDDLPMNDPPAYAELRRICRKRNVPLYSLAYVFSSYIWQLRKKGGTFTCFNASYDLSRLASTWHAATKSGRRGAKFINGFEFFRTWPTAKDEDGKPMLGADGKLGSRTVEAPFVRIRRDDRHHVRYDMHAANVLDLATLAFALRNEGGTLQDTCSAFGVEFEDRPGFHDGTVTEENVAGCLHDVAKTGELLYALGREYDRHPIDLPPWRAQSGASLAKAYLRAFGVAPRSELQPDFSKDHLGYAASAYFGGWVEARIVREPVPCVYLDAVSMYPSSFTLLDCWFGHITPARLEPEELDPKKVQALLDKLHVEPRRLLKKSAWPQLAFFALVEPNGAILPARAEIPSPYLIAEASEPSSHRLVTVGPVESKVPLWYAGPDLAAAAIAGAAQPRVLRAWRLRASGMQSTLRSLKFRGDDEIDPTTTNVFQRLIELRKRESGDSLDNKLRATGYKVIANSGSYGIYAQTTPEDIDPDLPRDGMPVSVWGLRAFETHVDRPEKHGRDCFFPTASLVTAGARLLLTIGRRLVHDAGGEVAYNDTDSLIVIASERGGFVRCEGGPYKMPDGTRAVRALSWVEVDRILEDLAALNVYDPSIVKGSSFQVEDENFDEHGQRREIVFYGTREKSYCLYARGENGEPVVVKHSAHTIGQYSSPLPGDRESTWIVEAWTHALREGLGLPVEDPAWFNLPALSQLTLTTWNVIKYYAQTPGVHPFDFLAVAQVAYPGLLRCCNAPRPSCPLFPDANRWTEQAWRCLTCDSPVNSYLADTGQSIFKTYSRAVGLLTHAIELKRLCSSGDEPNEENMRGFTTARPVRVEFVTHVGKEIIVDPTDTGEGLSAEELFGTTQVEYHDRRASLEELRERVKAFGIRKTASKARVSVRAVRNFVRGKTHPHPSTLRRLREATKLTRVP